MSSSEQPSPNRMTALVDELVSDLRPVRVLSLAAASSAALALQFVFVAAAAMAMGIDAPAVARIFQGPMATVFLLLVAASMACGLVAVRLAVPGRVVGKSMMMALASVPVLLATLCLCVAPSGSDWQHFAAHLGASMACFGETLLLAVPAWAVSLILLARLAPLAPMAVGFFGSLTALFQGALLVQLVCPSGEGFHLALSHYLPLAGMSVLAAAASGFLLRLALAPRRI